MSGALAGLRVVDCSRLIAGGVLATILADHGADVVKVEDPRGGDPLRTWLRDRGELWWKVYARGKRSITLNLAHPKGQAILRRLCRGADVLVENFLPGTFEKWGLGWDVLSADNPRLVFARGSGMKAMQLYVDAFGATVVDEPHLTPDGQLIHGHVHIGDSSIFLTDEGDEGRAPTSLGGQVSAVMAVHVPDVDAWWKRAIDAGFTVISPLVDQFYGDRGGRLRDPFGHQWMLSTHIEDVSREEMERRMQQMMLHGEG